MLRFCSHQLKIELYIYLKFLLSISTVIIVEITFFCDIPECEDKFSHTRWYHKCKKCGKRGHGIGKCGKIIFYIGLCDIEHSLLKCEVKTCSSKNSHNTSYHF